MLSYGAAFLLLQAAQTSLAMPHQARQEVTLFDPSGDFDYQIGGAFTPDSSVKIVSRDGASGSIAEGLYNICYVNVFQTQPDENEWWETNHKDLLLQSNGKVVSDPDWGEYIFNTASEEARDGLLEIVKPWIDTCASKGFNAVEADNLDTFSRFESEGLTKEGNLAFAKAVSDYAHFKGLAFAQKNTAELEQADKEAGGFDFAIAEECSQWDECPSYTDLYGNYVLVIEYEDNGKESFDKACSDLGSKLPITYRDRDVLPKGSNGFVDEHC